MKDYLAIEWKRMVAHAKKSLESSCPLIEDEVLVAVGDGMLQLSVANKVLQAKIDELMSNKYLMMSNNRDLDIRKIKADAIREFLDSVADTCQISGDDMQFLAKFADVYFEGEE